MAGAHPEDERQIASATGAQPPVFAIFAKDALAYPTVVYYAQIARQFGLETHANEAAAAAEEIRVWQQANIKSTHLPDHTHIPQENLND